MKIYAIIILRFSKGGIALEESYKEHTKAYSLIFLFLIYTVVSLFENALWGNILSPVVAFLSAAIVWKELRKIKTHKWNWITLFLGALGCGIADSVWLIASEILMINPTTLPIIGYLYLIGRIMITASCGIYFYYNLKKWNTLILFMDIVVIGTIILVSLIIIMFSKYNVKSFIYAEYICAFLFLFFDFISISGIIIMCGHYKGKTVTRSEILILISIIMFVICDLYLIYMDFMHKYDINSLLGVFFKIPIVLIAFAAMNESKYPTPIRMVCKDCIFDNDNKSSIFKWLLILPFILYFVSNDNIIIIIQMTIILITYIFTRGYVQLSIKNDYFLKREKSLNDILEYTVQKRTKELIEANKVLAKISKTDALTGFYSRRYFIDYIDSLISSNEKKSFALFYMDLDRFKSINDTHSHEMGDLVLKKIAKRLKNWCPPNVKLSRTGGDEFSALIEGDVSQKVLEKFATEIIKLCEKPILIDPYTLHVGVSIGIAIFPTHAKERKTLMKYADIAMYQLKKDYLSKRFTFFDNSLSEEIQRKHKIELLLQDADFDKEFELYFQPQYRACDDTLVGMEALIRWNSPTEGFISPGEFIPIAEETSLIIKIGEWVFDEAIKKIKYWNSKYNRDLRIGINISPKQINKSDFIKWLIDKIENSGVKTEWLELEITENSAMTSEIAMEEIFSSLGEFHISTAIDDFGTGYSSLSYIKRFHIDRLKIAKELIDNISSDHNTLLIVKAIIMMTRGMGLKTIAEGVEDEKQLKILKELQCDEIQGYIYGKPVPAHAFEEEHILKNIKKIEAV